MHEENLEIVHVKASFPSSTSVFQNPLELALPPDASGWTSLSGNQIFLTVFQLKHSLGNTF